LLKFPLLQKKPSYLIEGNPAASLKPVAFRPYLTVGLAFFLRKNNKGRQREQESLEGLKLVVSEKPLSLESPPY